MLVENGQLTVTMCIADAQERYPQGLLVVPMCDPATLAKKNARVKRGGIKKTPVAKGREAWKVPSSSINGDNVVKMISLKSLARHLPSGTYGCMILNNDGCYGLVYPANGHFHRTDLVVNVPEYMSLCVPGMGETATYHYAKNPSVKGVGNTSDRAQYIVKVVPASSLPAATKVPANKTCIVYVSKPYEGLFDVVPTDRLVVKEM